MLEVMRWVVAVVVGLPLFVAAGLALSRNDSDAVAALALLAIGLATLGVITYMAVSLVRGHRSRN